MRVATRPAARAARRGLIALVTGLIALAATPASAQVSETPSPTPIESPSATESPSPSPDPTPSVSAAPTEIASSTPTPDVGSPGSALPEPTGDPTLAPRLFANADDEQPMDRLEARARRATHRRSWAGWAPDPRWGTYGTASLDRAAAKARTHGWSRPKVDRRIYAPFIVEGPATWSDSWGAPRFTGGYHPHHGQDVLCAYGSPVLAVQRGTIAFGSDPLGGLDAYLQRADGGFWYYAHLRSFAGGVSTGDTVHAGQMIGRCGATGDATVPHVHFAYFTADRVAVDPMPALVVWLHRAVHRLTQHARTSPEADVVGLLHLPAPDPEPVFAEATASTVRIVGEPWSPVDRFLLTIALLMPLGWAATVVVAVRRRRRVVGASSG